MMEILLFTSGLAVGFTLGVLGHALCVMAKPWD